MSSAIRIAALGGAVLLLADGARAESAPLDAVRATLDRVSAIMATDAVRNDKIRSLHSEARALLDTRTMGRRVLGRRLVQEPPEVQEEFLALFDELIVRAWLQRILLFEEPRFEYIGLSGDPRRPVVHTKIRTDVDAYRIDYEMRENRAGWQAMDIRVEGISLLRSYHSQFEHLFERQSFEEVLARMQRKVKVLAEGQK